ncbi:MAG: flap endonuclease Xni [Thermodesulfobacteriota bacterium]|nr:flap endonuclease Xni [Thermodesulfobacteriota bacterium]
MNIKLLLIDALNLIRRVYAAQPGEDGPGRVNDALVTSVHSLQRALRECRPTHAICVFDGHEPNWRHELYPEYKTGHSPMPEDLNSRLNQFDKAFAEIGVRSVCFPALEADDIIATLAGKIASRGGNVIILSTDRMFLQLVSDLIVVRDHFNKLDMDQAYVMGKLNVQADQVVDLFALAGYTTNNITGVPTVGPKTAAKLLNELGDLDNILSVAYTIKGKLGEMLHQHTEDARMSQSLIRLKDDLKLGLNLKSFRYVTKP